MDDALQNSTNSIFQELARIDRYPIYTYMDTDLELLSNEKFTIHRRRRRFEVAKCFDIINIDDTEGA